jgi:hypothetical protein
MLPLTFRYRCMLAPFPTGLVCWIHYPTQTAEIRRHQGQAKQAVGFAAGVASFGAESHLTPLLKCLATFPCPKLTH